MPIEITGAAGSSTEVPAGIQVPFKIKKATFQPDGKHGPAVELDKVVTDPRYYGTPLKYWARIQQPRLDMVRRLRADGLGDKVIKDALKERGFDYKNIDEPDKMVVGRGGNLFKILVAGTGSPQAADQLLAECDSFDELAERMVDFEFVGTTKKSKDGKYVQLDGREEIFAVTKEPATVPANGDIDTTDSDEEFDEIPF